MLFLLSEFRELSCLASDLLSLNKRKLRSEPRSQGLFIQTDCHGEILDRHADRVVDGDLLVILTTRFQAEDDVTDLCMDVFLTLQGLLMFYWFRLYQDLLRRNLHRRSQCSRAFREQPCKNLVVHVASGDHAPRLRALRALPRE